MAGWNKVKLSKEHPDIGTSDNGGGNAEFEEILDLSPPTDVQYQLRDANLELLLDLDDSTDSDLSDDAKVRWIAQGPLQDDKKVLTREYRLGEFNNADQRDADQLTVFEFVVDQAELPATFTEAGHLKLEMLHDTDVSWTDSLIEFEIYRDAE